MYKYPPLENKSHLLVVELKRVAFFMSTNTTNSLTLRLCTYLVSLFLLPIEKTRELVRMRNSFSLFLN